MKIYVKADDYKLREKLFATFPEQIQNITTKFWIFYPTRYAWREYHLKLNDGTELSSSNIKDLRKQIDNYIDNHPEI